MNLDETIKLARDLVAVDDANSPGEFTGPNRAHHVVAVGLARCVLAMARVIEAAREQSRLSTLLDDLDPHEQREEYPRHAGVQVMERLRDIAADIGIADAGCIDNSCIWGRPGGMGTNGGCRCVDHEFDVTRLRREVRKMAMVATKLAKSRLTAADREALEWARRFSKLLDGRSGE